LKKSFEESLKKNRNFSEKSKFFKKIEIFGEQIKILEFFEENGNLGKIEIVEENGNFGETWKFREKNGKFWKIESLGGKSKFLEKNGNFGEKSKVLEKNRNFGEKSKFWRKIIFFVEKSNFCRKLTIFVEAKKIKVDFEIVAFKLPWIPELRLSPSLRPFL